MLRCMADLRIIYLYLTGPLDNVGRHYMIIPLIFIKGLLDQPIRYLEFDRHHNRSVPVIRIDSC